jgi:predicted RNase H-like HicB family nuclease
MDKVTSYGALVDGKPGAYGVAFPDCPGCTAMGRTIEEAILNASAALAEWAGDIRKMPPPRTLAQLSRDPEVKQTLAEGGSLMFIPLAATVRWRRYA